VKKVLGAADRHRQTDRQR